MKFITSLKVLFILLVSSAGFSVASGQRLLNLKSPNKNLVFQLSIKADGPEYQLNYKGASLIAPSALGFELTDLPGLPVTKIKLHSKKKIRNKYPERGLHSEARDNSRVYLVDFLAEEALEYQLEVKVADNGVAFRYLKTEAGTANLSADATRFVLPLGSTIWSQSDIHSYEGRYTKEAADTIAPGKKVGPPLTVLLPESGGYLAITEGGLVDMPGMSLLLTAPRTFTAVLAGPAVLSGHLQTGWRIIEYGRDLNDLVNNDMISNVSRPIDPVLFPQGLNTAWLKPGKSVWSWLTRNRSVTLPNMKQLTDWASELRIPYNLVDEGWGKWSASNKTKWDFIKELVDYSAPKHVGIWVWKAYPDRNGIPGLKDSVERATFFESCHEAGVVGVKIDFFDAESQEVIRFYEAALRDAAKYHIMVDFHGADKPTGLSRTYPNEMSREGIRGLENETDWPAHNTTLPFTRFLAGHGD
ncbi:MAG TPA: glycoside hydrolase family 97 catalytic domain-containing protein, partial [Arachidicoccus sp.]|nr:glycoside hydrolase family 97 catalytic domain-containing protein [Arachidicoccus sp.]